MTSGTNFSVEQTIEACLNTDDQTPPDPDKYAGDHAEVISELLNTYHNEGQEEARNHWETIVEQYPEINDLYSGEDRVDQFRPKHLKSALEDLPELKFYAEDLIYHECLGIVYGPPGSMKSMLLLQLGLCIADEKTFLLKGPDSTGESFTCHKGNVLYLDQDMGIRPIKRRLQAFFTALDIDPEVNFWYDSMPHPPLDMTDPKQLQNVKELVRNYETDVVIIDNLAAVTGNVEENDSEMGQVMLNFRKIAEECDCSVLVIHHQTKESKNRPGDSLRGHSSIEAAIDFSLLCKSKGDSDIVTVKRVKHRSLPPLEFGALFTYESRQDSTLKSAELKACDPKNFNEDVERAKEIIVEKMPPGANQSEVVDLVSRESNGNIGETNAKKARDQLQDQGKIEVEHGKNNANEHYLTEKT